MKYTVLLGYRFEQPWFTKNRKQRREFEAEHVLPVFARYSGQVSARFFSAAAFTTRYSNFILLETHDLKHFYFLVEELRDSALLSQGYATVTDILTGIEDGYPQYEREVEVA